MIDTPSFRLFGRIVLVVAIGLVVSLLVGTIVSFIPASPLEGLNGGVLFAGMLITLMYFALARARGTRKPRAWTFKIHSVLGLATGILMGVIFLSGVLLLYKSEIDVFTNPWLEVETADRHTSVDAWLASVGTRVDLSSSRRVNISWPENPKHPARIAINGKNGTERFFVNPYNALILEGELRSRMDWVRKLHVAFNFGTPGHWLAGIVALLTIWLCIGGLTMGRNVFRDCIRLRWTKGLPIFLSDLHKRIGLWLLPFIAINAFAGMLAALFGVLSAGPVEARFGGSYGALYEAVGSPPSVVRSERLVMPPLEGLIEIAKDIMPGATLRHLQIIGYGDRNAIVSIRASQQGDFAPKGSSLLLNIRASTGEVLLQQEIQKAGIFERISKGLAAFHVAAYGGEGVRRMHAITAVIVAILPFIGIAMWFLRRRRTREV